MPAGFHPWQATLLVLFAWQAAGAQQPALTPLFSNRGTPPFSFVFGGKSSRSLLHKWQTTSSTVVGNTSILHTLDYTDPKTRLVVSVELREFPGFPGAADWVVRFRNDAVVDTPVLEDLQPLDLKLHTLGEATVHYARGSNGDADDFRPEEQRIDKRHGLELASSGGDSSSGSALPMFNLEAGTGGYVFAVGWTGNWRAIFEVKHHALAVRAGMQHTHLVLHPGEEIRTPRIVVLPWASGDWHDAQNRWRALVLAQYSPQSFGQPPAHPMWGPVLAGSWGAESADHKLAYIHWLAQNRISIDLYGIDAGWYGDADGSEDNAPHAWWKSRGDWLPNPAHYPQGLAPLGEALHKAGIGFSLWLEPETAMPQTAWLLAHPAWFLADDHASPPGAHLLNLGNDDARDAAVALVSNLVTQAQLTWYRQDSNLRPASFWSLADTPDRIGMTEIRHIEGLYTFLDTLLAQHPGLRIDNCASGGRRLDVEMMSRSFAVWRTDYGWKDPKVVAEQTMALAPWVPQTMAFESLGASEPWNRSGPYSTPSNLYRFRAGYSTGFGVNPGAPGVENGAWISWIQKALGEYRELQPYFYGDFYALTPYRQQPADWTIAQWHRPGSQDGVVIALRHAGSTQGSAPLALHSIEPQSFYTVQLRTTLDNQHSQTMTGLALTRLTLSLPDAPSSMLVLYRRIAAAPGY